MFQHTAARRRLGPQQVFTLFMSRFQHTAARRRLVNPLIDAVCNTVNAIHPITGKTALVADGADVEYCRVEGTVETDEGTLGEQAVCIIPIVICAA